ncbi:MAG: chorismate-binding protein [Chitinophagales bacterium]|nr:chorismate-binding protein [Chitinophagales bacterium]
MYSPKPDIAKASIELLNKALSNDWPFVFFRIPGQESVLIVQQQKLDFRKRRNAFYMVPWPGSSNKPFYLRPDIVIKGKTSDFGDDFPILPLPIANIHHQASFDGYKQQVQAIKAAIQKGAIEKAILSRTKFVKNSRSPFAIFFDACNLYPSAFCYLSYSIETGCWMGATPETLLEIKDHRLFTMALAGSQRAPSMDEQPVQWGEKEVKEHEIVAETIAGILGEYFENFSQSDLQTIQAGNVLHLRTEFEAHLAKQIPTGFIDELHPTPAIAGYPKNAAIQLINKVEQHDRGYYTGYIGPNKVLGLTHLYVNLRCMQLFNGEARLYLGGGITMDSDEQKEWDETEWKADTMQRLLQA